MIETELAIITGFVLAITIVVLFVVYEYLSNKRRKRERERYQEVARQLKSGNFNVGYAPSARSHTSSYTSDDMLSSIHTNYDITSSSSDYSGGGGDYGGGGSSGEW